MLMYEESILPENLDPKNGIYELTIIEQGDNSAKYGNIHLGAKDLVNQQLIKAKVSAVSEMTKDYGLSVGDIVLFDRYAAYYRPTMEVGNRILIDLVSIICKLDEEGNIVPYGDYVLVVNKKSEKKEENIHLNRSKPIYQFTVVDKGNENSPVEIGEDIFIIVSGNVMLSISDEDYRLVPYECIIGRL